MIQKNLDRLTALADKVRECQKRNLRAIDEHEEAQVELRESKEALNIAQREFEAFAWSAFCLSSPSLFGLDRVIVEKEPA